MIRPINTLRLFAVAAMTLFAQPANAEESVSFTLACGAIESGYVYYAPGQIVPEDQAGWSEEEFDSHRLQIQFTVSDTGETESLLKLRDGTERWYTPALDEGNAVVLPLSFDWTADGSAHIVVVYKSGLASTVDSYVFTNIFGTERPAEVIYTQSRQAVIQSGKTAVASCTLMAQ